MDLNGAMVCRPSGIKEEDEMANRRNENMKKEKMSQCVSH